MPSGNPEPQAKLPLFCQQKLQVDEVSNFYGISQIGELENAACANFLSPLIYRATSFFGMGPLPTFGASHYARLHSTNIPEPQKLADAPLADARLADAPLANAQLTNA
jgi:hypothetical protein